MSVTLWHRPTCSNSRGALALLREAGIEPVIVDYIQQPPSVEQLRRAIADAGLSVREALRDKEPDYAQQGLADRSLSDAALLQAMVATPRCV